jgi:hypothetical protein
MCNAFGVFLRSAAGLLQILPPIAAARGLVRRFLLAVGGFGTVPGFSSVSLSLLLGTMAVVAFGLTVITVTAFTVVSMALEKCARHLPPVLFAGRGKHDGYGKDCDGDTGLHVRLTP